MLPYDPRRDEVVLIRQFRAGAYVAGRHPWTWELVAGIIENDETAEEHGPPRGRRGSRRSRSASCIAIHDVMLTPGRLLGILRRSSSAASTRSNAGGVFGLESEGENILVKVAAVRRGLRPARAQRDRQRRRRDRPAVAGAASRRGAQALALGDCAALSALPSGRERARDGRARHVMNVRSGFIDSIGNTPLIKLTRRIGGDGLRHLRQGGVPQSRRLGEGPRGARHHRGRREARHSSSPAA